MAANKLNETQKAAIKVFIAKCRLQGKTVDHIVTALPKEFEDLTLSRSTIHGYMKQIEADWLDEAKRDVATIKAQDLAALRLMEIEVWGEWERSKQDEVTVTTEVLTPENDYEEVPSRKVTRTEVDDPEAEDPREQEPAGTLIKEKRKVVGQCANTTYITALINITKRRAEMLGYDITKSSDAASDESQTVIAQMKDELKDNSEQFELENAD